MVQKKKSHRGKKIAPGWKYLRMMGTNQKEQKMDLPRQFQVQIYFSTIPPDYKFETHLSIIP